VARFHDRAEAGKVLARKLAQYADRGDTGVLALPRGGVPVGYEVARALKLPLDVFVVRKLGVPLHEEYAMGAIATGDVVVIDDEVATELGISNRVIEAVIERERVELARREREYRGDRPPPDVDGQTIILVDDGLATGSTMRAAIAALRRENASRVVVAVPLGAPETCSMLRAEADEVVCALTPEPFVAVGLWYENFEQTSDAEVRDFLARAARENPTHSTNPTQPSGRTTSSVHSAERRT